MQLGIRFGGNLKANLRRAINRSRNLERPLKLIGMQMQKSTDKTFKEEGRPKWTDLADSTKARRRRGPRATRKIAILQDRGDLRKSITYEVKRPSIIRWGPSRIAPYGIFHQLGTRKMPQRKFLGIYPEDQQRIKQIVGSEVKYIMGVRYMPGVRY
jgi:phage virion morphogenesis protein